MAKEELLRDSWSNAELSLVESIDTPKGDYSNGVVLATLRGPALDYVHDTRNNRGYEEDLWDSVVNSEYVQELFETKNFLGEPDHPFDWEDRADLHYPYVSHAITKLEKKPELGYYEVTLDILDTPNGRILKTLIDYGVKLGVSSRGSGRTITKNGRKIVDKRTYRFITIDIVPMPGNKAARMKNVDDQMVEKLVNALSEQVDLLCESHNVESLKYTKLLLDRLEYPECDSLLEKVNEVLSESNTDTSQDDLVEAYSLIAELRSQIASKDLIIKNLTESVHRSSDEQNTISELETNYAKAQELVKSSLMNESQLRRENKQLRESLERLTSERDKLNESVSELRDENVTLESKVRTVKLKSAKSENSVTKELEKLQESLEQKENDLMSLTEQLQYESDEKRKVCESYFTLRCSQLGIDASAMKRQLGDISAYPIDELNARLTESFKQGSARRNPIADGILSKGSHSFRSTRMDEKVSPEVEKRQSDLDRIRSNVAAVRNQ